MLDSVLSERSEKYAGEEAPQDVDVWKNLDEGWQLLGNASILRVVGKNANVRVRLILYEENSVCRKSGTNRNRLVYRDGLPVWHRVHF